LKERSEGAWPEETGREGGTRGGSNGKRERGTHSLNGILLKGGGVESHFRGQETEARIGALGGVKKKRENSKPAEVEREGGKWTGQKRQRTKKRREENALGNKVLKGKKTKDAKGERATVTM